MLSLRRRKDEHVSVTCPIPPPTASKAFAFLGAVLKYILDIHMDYP